MILVNSAEDGAERLKILYSRSWDVHELDFKQPVVVNDALRIRTYLMLDM